jgi:hypothetical protein
MACFLGGTMMTKSVSLLLTLITSCLILTGCGEVTQSDVSSKLKEKNLIPIVTNIIATHPPKTREGVALCKNAHGEEFILVLTPKGKELTTKLGGQYKTFEQMKEIATKLGLSPHPVPFITVDDTKLYWQDEDQQFDLTGKQIPLKLKRTPSMPTVFVNSSTRKSLNHFV